MNQKELYIQYLEDALNHAKTGEPMKHWQLRCGDGEWTDRQYEICNNLEKMSTGCLSIRIKPEPLKWTAFAYKDTFDDLCTGSCRLHIEREEISCRTSIPVDKILSVHHHEIETE